MIDVDWPSLLAGGVVTVAAAPVLRRISAKLDEAEQAQAQAGQAKATGELTRIHRARARTETPRGGEAGVGFRRDVCHLIRKLYNDNANRRNQIGSRND